jgi:hypothetical protein
MHPDDWSVLEVCSNHLAAEILASLMRSESVPVLIEAIGAVPGLEQGSRVLVPTDLMHRARWVLAQPKLTDEELELLATAKPPGSEPGA